MPDVSLHDCNLVKGKLQQQQLTVALVRKCDRPEVRVSPNVDADKSLIDPFPTLLQLLNNYKIAILSKSS